MSGTQCNQQLELFEVGRRVVTVDFQGGDVVSDAGLLPVRLLDQRLGILAEAARRMPDPRDQKNCTFSVEEILTQQVYQILAGYPDGNDSDLLRNDPLFKTLVGKSLEDGLPLASGSTVNRFVHAFTRREAQRPAEDRSTLSERRDAQIDRIRGLNEFLVDTFVRTRPTKPTHVVIDLDPSDDACHGQQQLSFFHGYYEQQQYFPLLAFEGETGMPLAACLRPGNTGAATGAVDVLQEITQRLRFHWPDILIFVRGDCGLACPEMYEFCESEGLFYTFGYATNAVLKQVVADRELEHSANLLSWITQRPTQVFDSIEDYQAGTWSRSRRILVKCEVTETGGLNTRFCVTNMSGLPGGIYRGYYVKRGNVPERPIGELKHGVSMDRLSSHRFLANAQKLLFHVLAYQLWALFREANSTTPELNKAELRTIRPRLFKVGALVRSSARRVWFHVASHWPGANLLTRATAAVHRYLTHLEPTAAWPPPTSRRPVRRAAATAPPKFALSLIK